MPASRVQKPLANHHSSRDRIKILRVAGMGRLFAGIHADKRGMSRPESEAIAPGVEHLRLANDAMGIDGNGNRCPPRLATQFVVMGKQPFEAMADPPHVKPEKRGDRASPPLRPDAVPASPAPQP
jgi:hypothetical protein